MSLKKQLKLFFFKRSCPNVSSCPCPPASMFQTTSLQTPSSLLPAHVLSQQLSHIAWQGGHHLTGDLFAGCHSLPGSTRDGAGRLTDSGLLLADDVIKGLTVGRITLCDVSNTGLEAGCVTLAQGGTGRGTGGAHSITAEGEQGDRRRRRRRT